MSNYLLYGLSGSGKSTIGKEVAKLGLDVVDADFDESLSSWASLESGERVSAPIPPYSQKWLDSHVWNWDTQRLNEILRGSGRIALLLVGGAHNQDQFTQLFDGLFAAYADDSTITSRLQSREPYRWLNGSPELVRTIKWNQSFVADHQGSSTVLLDGTLPASETATIIYKHINHGQ